REFSDHFALLLSDYSNSYESINEEHDNHTVAVGHYWENASLEAQIAELYDLILVDIHREIILPLNDTESAFGLWSAAAQDRAPRIKKAVKIANQTAQELDLLIAKLDHRRDLFLKELIIF
ncbi:MAG: hypothetical protein OEQ53_13760, partial [Saprospiraceae bacterium]|nr:hypothetical protein [Saprospiraceae bacterium]